MSIIKPTESSLNVTLRTPLNIIFDVQYKRQCRCVFSVTVCDVSWWTDDANLATTIGAPEQKLPITCQLSFG